MVYDVDGHEFLTKKSISLEPGQFDGHHRMAEALLGLGSPAVADVDLLETLRLAIAIQINFQVEQGIDPFVASSTYSSHSKQSINYRDRLTDPRAALMVAGVVAEDFDTYASRWASMRSYRTDE